MAPLPSPETPHEDHQADLCRQLSQWASRANRPDDWPVRSLDACARAGVYRWFLPAEVGGFDWSEAEQTRGYLRLAEADLTTTFIITQFIGACRRLISSENAIPRDGWMERLITGERFATVGISHLTTSRQHLATPVLRAIPVGAEASAHDAQAPRAAGGYRLDGVAPWVTGARHADLIVVAASLDDGRQLLAAVDTTSDGIRSGPGADLMALSPSCTDQVTFDNVWIGPEMLLAGPMKDVMRTAAGAGTGGLQTSTLAIGLARAAVRFLSSEAEKRGELRGIAEPLCQQVDDREDELLRAAMGEGCDAAQLRGEANRLVLRATQAALTAAKGAGFVEGHPAGRWCREALFFLVWSCPQPVAHAHLCELAGIQA